ncbi:MAG: O-antigen polymerase [Rhodococcus sp. (in: high G+C Gram-positive bacteria)]|uniref:O-antigen polymerase n=1 Tax=Rhodococcus sp. TaxID=1831 RepID=UPI002AD98589|nr:O-antigen polymerase [Rhodococcus sp. (in: high G+C Gram-positive bacteria)]
MAACNFVFILGSFIASPDRDPEPTHMQTQTRRRQLATTSKPRAIACSASIVFGILFLDIGLKDIGHPGVSSIFAGTFVEFGSSLVETKSSLVDGGLWVTPAAITVATSLLTCAAVLSGIEVALSRHDRWRAAAGMTAGTFLFAFIASAGTGIRNHLLVSIIIFAAAYLAARIYISGSGYRLPVQALIGGGVVGAGFLAWVVVVQSARRGDFSFARVGATLDYLRSWFAGYLPALSQWSSDADFEGGIPGVNLLRGVLTPLGLADGEGFSEQIRVISIGDGATSNAMTIFRVLILDFGYVGSIVVCAAAGFISQRIYQRVANGYPDALVPLAAVYAASFYSINYWFFAYGSRIAGAVLGFVVFVYSVRNGSADRRAAVSQAAGHIARGGARPSGGREVL